MFKEETVFILGAGASVPYGYPPGRALIKEIIQNIWQDSVYFPISMLSASTLDNGRDIVYPFHAFKEAIEKINIKDLDLIFETCARFGDEGIFVMIDGKKYKKIFLREIDIFYSLRKALISFDPLSIDAFLRDHESYAEAGRIMIVYSLLKCEAEIKFSRLGNTEQDNWYSCFINDILSGCNDPADVIKNKLNIITFNYSLDLDYCLLSKLKGVELYQKNETDREQMIKWLKSRIHHVYGQLYMDDILNSYGKFYRHSTDEEMMVNTKNFLRFIKAVDSKSSIKLIQDERRISQSKYNAFLRNAKEIIIIGFSFDRDNLDILGFPDKLKDYKDYFHGKKIKYMDFDGKMNSLYTDFSELRENFKNFVLSRSIATSISHAYQNDFKISLYNRN